jgi:hypothetical protein
MRTGAGLALICVGAILAFAVTATPSFFNLHIAGWVLMVIGVIGIVLPRRTYGWLGRRTLVRRTRSWPGNPGAPGSPGGPGNQRVQAIAVPPYLARNPGTSRAEAGLPPTPTLADPAVTREPGPEDAEVIEDLYEQ